MKPNVQLTIDNGQLKTKTFASLQFCGDMVLDVKLDCVFIGGFFMNAYHNIIVQLGGRLLPELRELKIIRKFNEHAQLRLTTLLPEGEAADFLESVGAQTAVEVKLADSEASRILFCGPVTALTVKAARDVYTLEIAAGSHTCDLDVAKTDRSFQNPALTYKSLVKTVIGTTTGADCIVNPRIADQKIGRFILQYRETDWQLLKRVASALGTGLIADAAAGGPKFWFGLPENDSRIVTAGVHYHYQVRKKLHSYREIEARQPSRALEDDFVNYEVELDEILRVGARLRFQNKSLMVTEAITELKQGDLKHRYCLTPEKGFLQNPAYNRLIAGLTLEGKVIEVEEDRVKLQLRIDGNQTPSEACWFSYASGFTSEGNTGWYCMPELSDWAKLYFPACREEEAYVISSVRRKERSGKRLQDPEIKRFRTVNGMAEADAFAKEMLFKRDQLHITLSGKDDNVLMIQIDDQKGVTVASGKELAIAAKRDININTGQKLRITAGEAIELQCRDSRIALNDLVEVEGVKINREMG
jgi:hypothetical protein